MTKLDRSLDLNDLGELAQAHFAALARHGIAGVWACLVLDRIRRLPLGSELQGRETLYTVDALAARWRGATNVDLADVTAVLGVSAAADLNRYRPKPADIELAASALLHALQIDGEAGAKAVLALDRLDLLQLNAENEFTTRATYRALGALWSQDSAHPLPDAFRTLERQYGADVTHIETHVNSCSARVARAVDTAVDGPSTC